MAADWLQRRTHTCVGRRSLSPASGYRCPVTPERVSSMDWNECPAWIGTGVEDALDASPGPTGRGLCVVSKASTVTLALATLAPRSTDRHGPTHDLHHNPAAVILVSVLYIFPVHVVKSEQQCGHRRNVFGRCEHSFPRRKRWGRGPLNLADLAGVAGVADVPWWTGRRQGRSGVIAADALPVDGGGRGSGLSFE